MNNVLNKMQQLRLLLVKEFNFYSNKAEKAFNFIVGEQSKPSAVSATAVKLDGIYFIQSPSKTIHESLATDEDKRNSIAVGVKMGNRFANVVLEDVLASTGNKIGLCKDDKCHCGSKQFFRDTFKRAIADWDGMANTNDIQDSLNPDINLGEYEYIPSMAQLHLILLNINEVNKALIEAEGEPMKDDCYWSSTQNSELMARWVSFRSGLSGSGCKDDCNFIRLSVSCTF